MDADSVSEILMPPWDTALSNTDGGHRWGMPEYRAYKVGLDGHFFGFEPLVCANDAEATEKAKRLVDGHDVELWSGERFIVRLDHK